MRNTIIAFSLLFTTQLALSNDELTLITIADAKSSPAVLIDLKNDGDSIGDKYIFDQPLLNTQGKEIGNNSGYCLRTKSMHSLQCQWTLSLKEGTIQVAGREFDKGESKISIVGGTGKYRYIQGEMTSIPIKGQYIQTLYYTLP